MDPQAIHDHPPLAAAPSDPRFQDNIHRNLLNRVEAERAALQEKLQYLAAQNKGLQTQLSESRRKQAEAECKVQPLSGPHDPTWNLATSLIHPLYPLPFRVRRK